MIQLGNTLVLDKNKIKIFEGARITDNSIINDNGDLAMFTVIFNDGCFIVKSINCKCGECNDLLLKDCYKEMEVIND